jgi:hypothetical protein
MAVSSRRVALTVDQLLEAVDHLSPAQRLEFQRRLAARQDENGVDERDDAALLRAARARLPAAAERRLKRLIARSEQGTLTRRELAEYQGLARDAQRLDAARAEALAELARRRGRSLRAVQAEVRRQGGRDGA